MRKIDLIEYYNQTTELISGKTILFMLCFGLFIASVIFITYKITYNGVAYSAKFNISNVVMLLITITIMIMISSNIVISLGMVGALSIIRFRTAIKDSRDTIFIFWSMIEGLSVGSQNFKLALISTAFIAIVLVVTSFYVRLSVKYLIIVRGDSSLKAEDITQILKSYNKYVKLRASNNTAHSTEMIFEALVKKDFKNKAIDHLRSVEGVGAVNILLETGDNVG